jgi:hypothetical protein
MFRLSRLPRKVKHSLILAAIVGAFSTLTLGILDLKHPKISEDTCYFVGQGLLLGDWKTKATKLYSIDGRPTHDIGLSCRIQGPVWLNDELIYPPRKGQPLKLVTTQYQALPTRYRLELPVVNTDPLELETKKRDAV